MRATFLNIEAASVTQLVTTRNGTFRHKNEDISIHYTDYNLLSLDLNNI